MHIFLHIYWKTANKHNQAFAWGQLLSLGFQEYYKQWQRYTTAAGESPSPVIWALNLTAALHNAEEAIRTFCRHLKSALFSTSKHRDALW